jgi:hypothetical protein
MCAKEKPLAVGLLEESLGLFLKKTLTVDGLLSGKLGAFLKRLIFNR